MRPTYPRPALAALKAPAAGLGFRLALAMAATISLLALAPIPSRAADAQALYVQGLAATCANCHGTQGKAQKDASVPGLAGLKADYIVEQMQAFKSGTRAATIMHQIAKGFNDEQVKQLADYFAGQK
ncbi:MAG: hypothetical protein RL404_2545 [Pseudomonadota bacterium]